MVIGPAADGLRSAPSPPATPLAARSTPASFSPISQPASAAISVRSLLSAEMADAEHAALHFTEPGAEREVEALVDELPYRIGIDAGRHHHAGEHRRIARRVGALDRQPPRLHGSAHACAPARVPREHVIEAFGEQHVERFAQAVEQVGVRRRRPVAVDVHGDDLVPGPEGARQGGPLGCFERARRNRVEADAGRQHQALLRAADGDVDAPFVVAQIGRAEAGDRVDEEERRMVRRVDRLAHGGDVGEGTGRGLVVHDAGPP